MLVVGCAVCTCARALVHSKSRMGTRVWSEIDTYWPMQPRKENTASPWSIQDFKMWSFFIP
jgi:hypothetical protein